MSFAEEVSTARHFAFEKSSQTIPHQPSALTVIEFQVPRSLANDVGIAFPDRLPLGEHFNLPFVDIAGGSGFERILTSPSAVARFNEALKSGVIKPRRLRIRWRTPPTAFEAGAFAAEGVAAHEELRRVVADGQSTTRVAVNALILLFRSRHVGPLEPFFLFVCTLLSDERKAVVAQAAITASTMLVIDASSLSPRVRADGNRAIRQVLPDIRNRSAVQTLLAQQGRTVQ